MGDGGIQDRSLGGRFGLAVWTWQPSAPGLEAAEALHALAQGEGLEESREGSR